ncbi:MAG: FliM/FliN family flagellar motor switch protein [Phycisphaerales bacterium]
MDRIERLRKLEVPVIVRLGEKTLTVAAVTSLMPGMIIELPKGAEEPLDLLVNNTPIGVGRAVKVGENFGLRIAAIGDERERLNALADPQAASRDAGAADEDEDVAALAAALLAGQ